MNTTTASIRRDSLLLRMAADRRQLAVALTRQRALKQPDLMDPETRGWLLTASLWALSALRMPAVVKVPLRTAASILLRNRVAALMHAPESARHDAGSGGGMPRREVPGQLARVQGQVGEATHAQDQVAVGPRVG
jgi:hypothetical protein